PYPPSPALRVLLWDIDGTLVRSARGGVFKDYTTPALVRLFGTAGRLHELSVSGMTDLQIVCEALSCEGFTTEEIAARSRELCAEYVAEFERMAGAGESLYSALPGAREVLEAVESHPRYLQSLLTGNVRGAAYWKLRLVGLADFFRLPGAFGEDSHDRRDLPALAAARINGSLKLSLAPSQFVVVGDTPNDIACAKHFGARSVALSTGRTYTNADLRACQPDAVLETLADTDAVLRALAGL
ncbi:MAG: haloacid dehalogenase-like hydrolase, partial [Acidobacteria bacterium]|nr:haloacid dehalogenase-like hydrolase [Acidobacteriota bacterium]